jgi:hypothetical protein
MNIAALIKPVLQGLDLDKILKSKHDFYCKKYNVAHIGILIIESTTPDKFIIQIVTFENRQPKPLEEIPAQEFLQTLLNSI